MSTPADVVQDLSTLLEELAKLLETDTAKQAPNIARDLGALPQLGQGIDAVKGGLDKIRSGVVPLQTKLLEADALVAMIGFVPPLVSGLGDAVQASGDYLSDLGLAPALNDASRIAGSAVGPIKQISGVLDMGVDVAEGALALTAPDKWPGVVSSLDHLSRSLVALKEPTAPASGA